jgi:SAM-dependent methyltransferase
MNKPHKPTLDLVGHSHMKGVELGAAMPRNEQGNSFFLDECINVAPRWSEKVYYDGDRYGRGFIHLHGHAEDIPLKDNRIDYVLSSHVLEHVPNPLNAFYEWDRVVRPEGYVLMIVPHHDALKSDKRPLEWFTRERLLRAWREKWTWDEHPLAASSGGKYGHYWKFTPELLTGFIEEWLPWWGLVMLEDPDSKVGNGFFLAYQIGERE